MTHMFCVSCKIKGKVKIKDVAYCNVCFLKQLHRKVYRVLKGSNGKLQIKDNGGIMCNILYAISKECITTNKLSSVELVTEVSDDAAIIYEESLFDIVTLILESFAKDVDLNLNLFEGKFFEKDFLSYRPLLEITQKEIQFFYFLNREALKNYKNPDISKERKAMHNFVNVLTEKNYSMPYNCVRVIKKIFKDEKLIMENKTN